MKTKMCIRDRCMTAAPTGLGVPALVKLAGVDVYKRQEELNWPRPPLAMICMDICSFKKAIAGLSEQDILEKKFLVSECLRTYMPQSVVVSQSDSFVCIFPEYAQPKEVLNTCLLYTSRCV